MSSILDKIKEAGLVGRGGASFPVAQKWASVAKAMEAKSAERCFVVCNVSEGEPGVKKDRYILEHHPEKVIDGINLAIGFFGAEKGIIYINHDYAKEFGKKLAELVAGTKIGVFIKPEEAGYIGGEESTALNVIEGLKAEPRLRPPFPVERGLWGFPTLVNNVETFLNVSLVNSGEYRKLRFFTVNGACEKEGVFELPESYTIEQVLKESGNHPDIPFFVQVGGNGSGEVLNSTQLGKPATGAGSIAVYKLGKTKPRDLIYKWIYFFFSESCGQCTACREGTYRLEEILSSDKPNWPMFLNLLANLKDTAFCGLGGAVPGPIFSYLDNVVMASADESDEKLNELKAAYKARKQ